MKKLLALTMIALITYSCKKDEAATCTWQNSTLNDKTYKITKIVTAGIDVTTVSQSFDPCLKNSAKFNASGTITETLVSGCSSATINGASWKTHTAAGKNYLIIGTDTTLINSFDCNSVTTSETLGTSTTLTTWTKQ